jgi:hypothetical protein
MSKHSSKRIAARQAELARRKRRHSSAPLEAPEPELGEGTGVAEAPAAAVASGGAPAEPGALPEFVARGRGQQPQFAGRVLSKKPVAASQYFTQDLRLIALLSAAFLAILVILAFIIE